MPYLPLDHTPAAGLDTEHTCDLTGSFSADSSLLTGINVHKCTLYTEGGADKSWANWVKGGPDGASSSVGAQVRGDPRATTTVAATTASRL